jgi:hypothetical protein
MEKTTRTRSRDSRDLDNMQKMAKRRGLALRKRGDYFVLTDHANAEMAFHDLGLVRDAIRRKT